MRRLFTFLLLLICSVTAYASVELPDFSFTGKEEITGFSIRPSFKHVSVSFSVQSSFDSYLRQESFNLSKLDTKEYKSDDPGGMYSGGFGTAVSSVFVGEKAYRNNIVKSYLDKQYLSVIQSYQKYNPKIEKTKFAEEVNLVYASALLETGSISNSFTIIKKIAAGDGDFRNIAADRYAKYALDTKNYEDFDIFASGLKRITPYTLYTWLYSLMQLERYDRVIEVFEANSEITSQDARFYDFYIMARYSQGGFDDVIASKDKVSDNTAGIIADACLVRDNSQCARDMYAKIPDSDMKKVIYGKLAVAEKRSDDAVKALNALTNDEDKLNIFLFYISRNFPNLDTDFMDNFVFASKINDDYIKFYKGLYYLTNRDNENAIHYLDGIIFNRELVNTSYYYRGLAYASVDSARAQRYLLKFIELSSDEQKLMVSRYVLGQLYYLDGRYDDSLMLVQSCQTDYCRILKAKIFLDKGDLTSAWDNADKVRGDEASLVRASILYSRKMYDDSLKQLKLIANPDTQSDLLMMLCYLKLGDTKSAGVVYNRHSNDQKFINAYIDHLFLAGQYQKVLDLTDTRRQAFATVRAKALFSLGRMKDAASAFRSVIDSGQNTFDAWYGLLSSYQAMGDQQKFSDTAKEITSVNELFDKKDFLILQAAKMALDNKDTKLATVMLNHFFDTFTVSVYMREAHLLRGQLFRDTGRVEQCLADADMIDKDGKSDEADFLKGECLEGSKKADAIKIFEGLAQSSDRFRDLSYGKLSQLYDTPKELLKAVTYFKDKDSKTYYSGLDRYFAMLSPSELLQNKPFIDMIVVEGNPAGLPAAYYYSGMLSLNDKDYEDSVRLFMKSYYLYPDSPYAAKSLKKAIEADEAAGKTDEAAIMKTKLKSITK